MQLQRRSWTPLCFIWCIVVVINHRDPANNREPHEATIQWLQFCIFYSHLSSGLRVEWLYWTVWAAAEFYFSIWFIWWFSLQLLFRASSANVCACLQKPRDEWPRMLNLTQNISAGGSVQKWFSEGDQPSHSFLVSWSLVLFKMLSFWQTDFESFGHFTVLHTASVHPMLLLDS